MYYDLNVPYNPSAADLTRTLSLLKTLGYTTIAISHPLSGKLPSEIPSPSPLPSEAPSDLTLLSRCTLTLTDPSQNHRLAALTNVYDILALRPTTEKLLMQCVSTLECDLISLDCSTRLPFPLKHKTVGMALKRGILFELSYSAAINDVAARRHMLQNAAALVRATRGGRGIVISSEAKQVLGLRGPNDVMNLACLWGLGSDRARDGVCALARSVVVQARMRRVSHKGVIEVIDDGIGEKETAERKRKAEEMNLKRSSSDKKIKGTGRDEGGEGGEKLSKKERKKQAREAALKAVETKNSL